jgi:hypothetical protein
MRNTTTETSPAPVSTGWEPCTNFTAEAAASPVCAGCGWLAPEHDADPPLAS